MKCEANNRGVENTMPIGNVFFPYMVMIKLYGMLLWSFDFRYPNKWGCCKLIIIPTCENFKYHCAQFNQARLLNLNKISTSNKVQSEHTMLCCFPLDRSLPRTYAQMFLHISFVFFANLRAHLVCISLSHRTHEPCIWQIDEHQSM